MWVHPGPAKHPDFAPILIYKIHNQLDGGCLPCPVGSDKTHNIPVWYREGYIVQMKTLKFFRKIVHFQYVCHYRYTSPKIRSSILCSSARLMPSILLSDTTSNIFSSTILILFSLSSSALCPEI